MESPGKAAPPVSPCWVRDGEGALCIAGLAPGALSPTSGMAGSAWWKHRRAERLAALSWTTGVWGCLGVPELCQGPSTWWASGAAGYWNRNGGARGGGGRGGWWHSTGPLSVLASLDRPSATASSFLRRLSPVDPLRCCFSEREGAAFRGQGQGS